MLCGLGFLCHQHQTMLTHFFSISMEFALNISNSSVTVNTKVCDGIKDFPPHIMHVVILMPSKDYKTFLKEEKVKRIAKPEIYIFSATQSLHMR